MLAGQRAFELGEDFVQRDRGEEAEAAEVYRKQRDLAAADGARRGEQRPVATQHDHQIAAFRNVGPWIRLATRAYADVSRSQRVRMPRAPSQSISLGTR